MIIGDLNWGVSLGDLKKKKLYIFFIDFFYIFFSGQQDYHGVCSGGPPKFMVAPGGGFHQDVSQTSSTPWWNHLSDLSFGAFYKMLCIFLSLVCIERLCFCCLLLCLVFPMISDAVTLAFLILYGPWNENRILCCNCTACSRCRKNTTQVHGLVSDTRAPWCRSSYYIQMYKTYMHMQFSMSTSKPSI